ncbi:MAG: thiamine-phosphate kinase, partial [Pseudanabaenaceae cyanobacterium]
LPDHSVVITTDMLVEGVHFSPQTTAAEDVGWRAAAASLSDLAAMGGKPWGLVVAVGLQPETAVSWIEGVYRGFQECLKTYDTVLVGGDTVRSHCNVISVTALGQVPYNQAIYRHTAKPGDRVLITGAHGLSKAGLEILLQPELGVDLTEQEREMLHRAHQRPCPRLDVIPLLWQYTDRVCGMDSSDGLADAILQICHLSQVGCTIDWANFPLPASVEKVARVAQANPLDWVLYGGEDFELVLCLPDTAAIALQKQLPGSLIIGTITEGEGGINLPQGRAFQHFV